jgi:nucleoside-diphosphate-sugar epimerase
MPNDKWNVVTGATGLLGSHLVEALVQRDEPVRALVRPSSDCSFLRGLGVDLCEGDLADPDSVRRAVEGATVVYHCAARVGDWGPASAFQGAIVDTTRHVVEACRSAGVGRLLHVSSIAAYGRPPWPAGPLDEELPLGRNLWPNDHYPRAKVEAEKLVWESGLPVTVVRPSWFYGPRDRTTMPRVVTALRKRQVSILGTGDNLLNLIFAGDVATGAILAANHPHAVGRAYNLSSEGEVTQRDLVNVLTDKLGLPRVTRRVPIWLAMAGASALERFARLFRWEQPPAITPYRIGLLSRPTRFSSARARTELGWQQRVGIAEGVELSLRWFLDQEKAPADRPLLSPTGGS